MASRLPKKLFRVASLNPAKRHYWQGAGGTFATKANAMSRIADIRKRGGDAELYETECNWTKVEG